MSGSDEAEPSGQTRCEMTAAQSRAARGLLDWSLSDLAARSGVDEREVRAFESGTGDPASGRVDALRSALMAAGIAFADGGVRLGGGGGDEGTRLDDLTTENDR